MTDASKTRLPEHGNPYNIFIFLLTILSLVVMVLLLLPLSQPTLEALVFYDNLICVVFLVDFAFNMLTTRPRRLYFITRRGWLDLLGSIPSLGILRVTALFRLFRLSRLARITRLMREQEKGSLLKDLLRNRGQYAAFTVVLMIILTLTASSVLVLQFESTAPGANITTGGDALWWSVVTLTTVGYGDFYPVTILGRMTGVAVMFVGVGVIGALASILASVLVTSPDDSADDDSAADAAGEPSAAPAASQPQFPELVELRAEMARMRDELREVRERFGVPDQPA